MLDGTFEGGSIASVLAGIKPAAIAAIRTAILKVGYNFYENKCKKSPSFGLLLKVYSIVRTRLNPCTYWLKS
jgi:hypothetical protein